MQRFDRYVLRVFLAHWVVVGAAFLGLFAVMDVLGKSDDIARAREELGIGWDSVARYYLLDLPFQLLQYAPYITLLSGLGSVLTLLRNREWTPVLSAGRPTWRAFAPLFLAAGAVGLGLSLVREAAVPRLLPQHEALRWEIFQQESWTPEGLWARGAGDTRLKATLYHPAADGNPPSIEGLEVFRRIAPRGDETLTADLATWDGAAWILEGGAITGTDGRRDEITSFASIGLGPSDLTRAYFGRARPLDLSAADCQALLRADPDHRQAATLSWAWRMTPFVHLVLLALGLPFALSFERRSSLEGLATGLLFCALYFVVELLVRDLGGRGVLEPWLAGSAPILLFGSLGLWAFDRVPT